MDWKPLLLVGLGGALGSIARYVAVTLVQSAGPGATFPYGTLLVNVLGCFAIGLLYARTDDPLLRLLLGVGVLGGFTTWSSFGNDTWVLAEGGRPGLAAAYVIGTVAVGLAAVWAGRGLAA